MNAMKPRDLQRLAAAWHVTFMRLREAALDMSFYPYMRHKCASIIVDALAENQTLMQVMDYMGYRTGEISEWTPAQLDAGCKEQHRRIERIIKALGELRARQDVDLDALAGDIITFQAIAERIVSNASQ